MEHLYPFATSPANLEAEKETSVLSGIHEYASSISVPWKEKGGAYGKVYWNLEVLNLLVSWVSQS